VKACWCEHLDDILDMIFCGPEFIIFAVRKLSVIVLTTVPQIEIGLYHISGASQANLIVLLPML
jgi:hypothetical protein